MIRVWICISLLVLTFGCASPVRELWPPQEGARAHIIIVSVDTWHAMIAFPQEAPGEVSRRRPLFEEWGYAEQSWYLEGRQGLGGGLRALFWPSAGVIEVGLQTQVWAERTSQPPSDRFTFHISEQGYIRLRRYLQSSIAALDPVFTAGNTNFYPASRSYHFFHQCHQYSARALREAGLPVSVFWAFNRGSFAAQLRRAERIAAEGKP